MIKGVVKNSIKAQLAKYLGLPEKLKVKVLLGRAGFKGTKETFYRRMRAYNDVKIALQEWQPDRGNLNSQLKKMLGVTGDISIDDMLIMGDIKWCRCTLNRRLAQGMTIEDATDDGCGMSAAKEELLKHMPGDPRDTVSDILKANGYTATYKTIHDHIRRGKSVDEAVKAATKKCLIARITDAIIEPQTWVSIQEIVRNADCKVQAARNNVKFLVDNVVVKMHVHDRAQYFCDARIANNIEPVSTDRESDVTKYLESQDRFKSVREISHGIGITKRWAGILLTRMHAKGLVRRKKVKVDGRQQYVYRTKVNLKWI